MVQDLHAMTFCSSVSDKLFILGYKNYSLQNITNAGETNGLLLTLNVQLRDYRPDTESIGFKVLIHDQDEPIFINEGGFAVMPGRKALVSVTKAQVCPVSIVCIYIYTYIYIYIYIYNKNNSIQFFN